jgi:hypothetical protein
VEDRGVRVVPPFRVRTSMEDRTMSVGATKPSRLQETTKP